MLHIAESQVAEHWKRCKLDVSPGSVTKQLGSVFTKSVLQRAVLQLCLHTKSVCKLQNLAQFELHICKIESVWEIELTFQGRRAEANHVSYFYKVPERLSAETSSQALSSHPSRLALVSTLPPLVPQWEYLGRLFSSWTHFKLHAGSS